MLFIGVAFFTSCDKNLLNVAPPDKLSTTIFWKSPSDADLALTGLYNYLYAGGGTYATGEYEPYVWDNFSDNSYGQNHSGGVGVEVLAAGMTPQTGGYVHQVYVNNYQAIAAINSFLANVGRVLSGEKLKEYKGQAFFLRAFSYWWLAKLYGNVPIVKNNPFTISYTAHKATSPRDSVLLFIESDLDSAIAYLPNVPYTDGHAVKGTAEGYMVRVLLFENKYSQAAAMAKQIMDQGQFSLNPCYSCNFYKPDQNSSKEIMFSVKYQAPTILHPGNLSSAEQTVDFKSELGTQDLINAYEMANGRSITDPTSGYDPNDPWSDRDPRMRMTFFFPGDTKAQGWPFTQYPVAVPGQNGWIKGYYVVRKWLTPGITDPNDATVDDNDFVLLRYAGVLLMYAEAQNEAVGPDQSVYQAINQVRERVGMPDLPPGMTQDQMRQAIRLERRVEFAMEGIRYFDLRRWGIATQVLNGFVQNPLYYPNIKTKYQPNYDFWPIPQYEIDFNAPEMKQNPGY